MGERELLDRLETLGIAYSLHRHPALRTVEEAKQLRGEIHAAHLKNLFLRDKREAMWLLVVPEDRPVDLRALREPLGAKGNPSFGSPERLMRYLGVLPGAVSPLAAVNDVDRRVTVVIDRSLLAAERIGAHPLHNEATVVLRSADLVRFLEATGHPPAVLDIG